MRPVMKRVVEDVSILDHHVGQLFEEGTRKDQSSGEVQLLYDQSNAMVGAEQSASRNKCVALVLFMCVLAGIEYCTGIFHTMPSAVSKSKLDFLHLLLCSL